MDSTKALWAQRDQVIQTLYVPPALQTAFPNHLIGESVPEDLSEAIVRWDLPRLSNTLELFGRGAATRFFNLPSARRAIEHALRAESETIGEWLTNEDDVRFSLDYFGDNEDWIVGYGILDANQSQLHFTRTLRVVLQRVAGTSYVLWSAFPLLSPRSSCWLESYDFQAHPPATRLSPLFYYFLSNYLTVTSDCVFIILFSCRRN